MYVMYVSLLCYVYIAEICYITAFWCNISVEDGGDNRFVFTVILFDSVESSYYDLCL